MTLRRHAFSLVELVATISVVALLAGVTTAVMSRAVGEHGVTNRAFELTTRASLAMTRIADEFRLIQTATGQDRLDLSNLTPGRVTWTSGQEVRLSGSSIIHRAADGTESILCDGCSSLVFTGYDQDGVAIPANPTPPQLASVTRIGVDMVLSDQGGQAHLRTRVFPWSLLRSPN
jgi:prepilin-type N-terminal cleavage/methylation domain-containing protein